MHPFRTKSFHNKSKFNKMHIEHFIIAWSVCFLFQGFNMNNIFAQQGQFKLNEKTLNFHTVLYLKESKISSIEFLNQEGFLLCICIFAVNCFKN